MKNCFMNSQGKGKTALLEEYKAEMERHQKAVNDIMKKYIPDYGKEFEKI